MILDNTTCPCALFIVIAKAKRTGNGHRAIMNWCALWVESKLMRGIRTVFFAFGPLTIFQFRFEVLLPVELVVCRFVSQRTVTTATLKFLRRITGQFVFKIKQ